MRFVARIVLLALALALLGLALTPKASPAQVAGPCSPDRPVPYWWHLRPAQPCDGDSVTLVFASCTECVRLVGAISMGPGDLRLSAELPETCPAITLCTPDSIQVPLGKLSSGSYGFMVSVMGLVHLQNGGSCVIWHSDSLAFTVCGAPPPPPPGDLLPFTSVIRIGPPAPCDTCPPVVCARKPIPLHLAGVLPNDCNWRFEKLELFYLRGGIAPAPPIVRVTVRDNECIDCYSITPLPWSADTILPALPAGAYGLVVQMEVKHECSLEPDSVWSVVRPFSVRDSCPSPPPDPCAASRPVPHWWYPHPEQPCEGDSVTVFFGSCRECVDLTGYSWSSVHGLVIQARMPVECPAIDMCTLDSLAVPLGRLAAGFHRIPVLVVADVVKGDSVLHCRLTRPDTVIITVGCPPPPPPPPPVDSLLPFVSRILIGAPTPCLECPPVICPFRPIPLRLAGEFPSFCYQFEKLELLPSPIMGPRPEPPIVRLTMSRRDCAPCALALEPWSAETLLPGLPRGTYDLMFQLRLVSMCSSFVAETTYYATRPFTVLDSCQVVPPEPCVWADWVHTGGRCDDFIVPGGRAKATMTITSPVPLAGLEGQLSLWPRGLLITNLEPVGRAAGMRIAWQRTPEGAKFLMFAEQGAPIGGLRDCNAGLRCSEPVLAVSMVKDTDAVLAPVTQLTLGSLLGADSLGGAVPWCNVMTFRFAPVEARICSGPSCDFNLDGRLDVRDLVVMVHCILGSGPCPDTSSAGLDCNGDGRLGVDDVLCCARVILHGGERDTVPGRLEPGVTVELGVPAWSAEGLEVPFTLARPDRVGAARLVLDYTSDRYEVAGVEFSQPAPEWLVVHEVVEGKLVVGVIGLGAGGAASGDGTLGLRLRLKAKLGASGGGSVTVVDQQFSGRDGVTLEVPVNGGAVSLPAAGALALSAARPNPFADETRFGLNLEHGAEAEVAIYDLSGRRVATLHQGALSAGPHEFHWRGERSDGARARAGVYFVQARVGSEKLTRKVVFLRGD